MAAPMTRVSEDLIEEARRLVEQRTSDPLGRRPSNREIVDHALRELIAGMKEEQPR